MCEIQCRVGDGYSDIMIEIEAQEIGIVIELKYAENAAFDAGCREAVRQIREKKYEEALQRRNEDNLPVRHCVLSETLQGYLRLTLHTNIVNEISNIITYRMTVRSRKL